MRISRVSLFVFAFLAPTLGALAAESALTVISGGKTVSYTAQDIAAMPRTELTLPARGDQDEERFSGVAMRELLVRAGAPLGDRMRGKGLMMGVIVRCKDNYAVLYSLAEFDENFSTRTILLADKQDGEELPPTAAPFRVVTPGDKRGARSCKQVISIEIVSLAKP